jgi:hypothetical protein
MRMSDSAGSALTGPERTAQDQRGALQCAGELGNVLYIG